MADLRKYESVFGILRKNNKKGISFCLYKLQHGECCMHIANSLGKKQQTVLERKQRRLLTQLNMDAFFSSLL